MGVRSDIKEKLNKETEILGLNEEIKVLYNKNSQRYNTIQF